MTKHADDDSDVAHRCPGILMSVCPMQSVVPSVACGRTYLMSSGDSEGVRHESLTRPAHTED